MSISKIQSQVRHRQSRNFEDGHSRLEGRREEYSAL